MIDVHCHLNFHSFKDDSDAVIKKALEDGVTRIINVGTKLDSSKWAIELAEKYDALYAIVGVHPHHADKLEVDKEAKSEDDNVESWIEGLEKLTKHPKVIGIGECGLDYYSYQSNGIVDPKLQREIFEAQIDLSYKAKLPLQIHNRHAGEDVIEILQNKRNKLLNVPGMFHCFAGSMDVLKDALDLGFYIGFDGNSTYKGLAPGESVTLPELASYTPLERLVVETDSPYLTPVPHRGKRNVPSYVIITATFLAQLKSVPFDSFVAQTTKNVYTIFNKLR